MSEEDLEVLITLDDPGEDTLEEDTFHQADNTGAHQSSQPPGDAAGKKQLHGDDDSNPVRSV